MRNSFKIALVGRSNVGKSALFNRIVKKRKAIVDEQEGVTRDRIYGEAEFFGSTFEVIDTGGIQQGSEIPFLSEVRRQADIAISEADSIIMVVDGRIGVTAMDEVVSGMLKRLSKPLCLAVNKIDNASQELLAADFYSLGIQNMCTVSALQGNHIVELLEKAFIPSSKQYHLESNDSLKIAIIGRPNVGKSTLVNALLNEERCVVSSIPGTTRDSIDVTVSLDDDSFTFIDTAGVRRKKSEHEAVDKFAAIRTERAIKRADVCLLMLDVQEGLSVQDKKIACQIEKEGKGCILLFNKWDAVKGYRMEHCKAALEEEAFFLRYCPSLFISAKTGRNLQNIFPLIQQVHRFLHLRLPTGQLNSFIEKALQRRSPPMLQGKRLRIYYMAQVDTNPPRFVFFVNKVALMDETYKKYLINQFREHHHFTGAPLLFFLKGKSLSRKAPTEPLASNPSKELVFEENSLT